MPYDLAVIQQYAVAGKNFNTTKTISKPDVDAKEETVAIAWSGVLTTRTNGTDGSLTMDSASHVITNGDKIDIYWLDASNVQQSCRGATVGVVAGTVVPFTGASGTALPAATTVIQACVVLSQTFNLVGNNVATLLAGSDFAACTIVLLGTGGTVELLVINLASLESYSWLGSGTNPLAGATVDKVHFSHNNTVTTEKVRVTAQMDL